jgi:hypothetical protein
MAAIKQPRFQHCPSSQDDGYAPTVGFADRVDLLIRLLKRLIVRLAIVIAILAGLHGVASIPIYFVSTTEKDAAAGLLTQQLQDAWSKTQHNREAIYAVLRENGSLERDKRTVDAHIDAWQRHFFDPLYAFVIYGNADAAWYQAMLHIFRGINIGPDAWVRFQKNQIVVPWGPHDEHLQLPNGMKLREFTEAIGENWETPHFYSTWFGDGGTEQMFGTGLVNDAALWTRARALSVSNNTEQAAKAGNTKPDR